MRPPLYSWPTAAYCLIVFFLNSQCGFIIEMNKQSSLSDEQWNRLLDKMANKQPLAPALHAHAHAHAHASDPGYGDFSTENLNPTATDNLNPSANYAEANLTTFAAAQVSEIRDIDDHSLADLRMLSKELEMVKQR